MTYNEKLEELQRIIGYHFRNVKLLKQALTHSSYTNEKHMSRTQSYEQLEFIGDAVLDLACTDYLIDKNSKAAEGELTRERSELVCEKALSQKGREIGIGQYIRLGNGEKQQNGQDKDRILCNVVESVIGAVYKDSGFYAAREFIMQHVLNNIKTIPDTDYKTRLQVLIGGKYELLQYKLQSAAGADNEKIYTVAAVLDGTEIGTGTGNNKRTAEQMAAKEAIEKLSK